MPGKGIVLLSVNWGRRYGCPGVANAQLLRLTPRRDHLRFTWQTLVDAYFNNVRIGHFLEILLREAKP